MPLTFFQRLMWERMPKERYGWPGIYDRIIVFLCRCVGWLFVKARLDRVILKVRDMFDH